MYETTIYEALEQIEAYRAYLDQEEARGLDQCDALMQGSLEAYGTYAG